MLLDSSLASVECPTSSKLSVAFPPACSLRTSSPPGCWDQKQAHPGVNRMIHQNRGCWCCFSSHLWLFTWQQFELKAKSSAFVFELFIQEVETGSKRSSDGLRSGTVQTVGHLCFAGLQSSWDPLGATLLTELRHWSINDLLRPTEPVQRFHSWIQRHLNRPERLAAALWSLFGFVCFPWCSVTVNSSLSCRTSWFHLEVTWPPRAAGHAHRGPGVANYWEEITIWVNRSEPFWFPNIRSHVSHRDSLLRCSYRVSATT